MQPVIDRLGRRSHTADTVPLWLAIGFLAAVYADQPAAQAAPDRSRSARKRTSSKKPPRSPSRRKRAKKKPKKELAGPPAGVRSKPLSDIVQLDLENLDKPAEEKAYRFSIKDGTYADLIDGFERATGIPVIGARPQGGGVSFVSAEEMDFRTVLNRVFARGRRAELTLMRRGERVAATLLR